MRVQPVAPFAAHVEMEFIEPSLHAHRFDQGELDDLLHKQDVVPDVLAAAVNAVLSSRPREPLQLLVRGWAQKHKLLAGPLSVAVLLYESGCCCLGVWLGV